MMPHLATPADMLPYRVLVMAAILELLVFAGVCVVLFLGARWLYRVGREDRD